MTDEQIDFEKTLGELETLVERLEKGDLPLEETLEHFERGIGLTRRCERALRDAEQKVEILLSKNAEAQPEAFDADAAD